MDDQELERRLSELKETWRTPRNPPLEQLWPAIEARAFPVEGPRRPWRWTRTLLPLAATLVLGFGLGQLSPALLRNSEPLPVERAGAATPAIAANNTAPQGAETAPFVGIATDYLERVTALLVTLADASPRNSQLAEYSTRQARDLLATTRLLMDSPQASDPHLQELLDDLELVLAQIVRLPHRAAAPDVYLIDQAVDQREVLPRLRELLAENSTSQP
jgi:hypothetical protein